MSFISRVQLRRGTAAQSAVANIVSTGARSDLGHRLIWTLFASDPKATRDFLYRETEPSRYIVVSRRPPDPQNELWRSETKPYDPRFKQGDLLGFHLRANATRSLRSADGARGRRVDATLRLPPGGDVSSQALNLRSRAALSWLMGRGAALGAIFKTDGCWVDALEAITIRREGCQPIRFTAAEFTGILEVTEPVLLTAAMIAGVGRAKAYGCGLMLVRPLAPDSAA